MVVVRALGPFFDYLDPMNGHGFPVTLLHGIYASILAMRAIHVGFALFTNTLFCFLS